MHRPVCVEEILEVLAPQPGELAVDATLGYGGHALEIARAVAPGGRLIRAGRRSARTAAHRSAACAPRAFAPKPLIVRRTNFAGLPQLLAAEGCRAVDMVLADLGVSSMQIDNPERGLLFQARRTARFAHEPAARTARLRLACGNR